MTDFGVAWSTFYRTIGVVGLVAVVASESGLPLFGMIEPLIIATVLLVVFAVATAYQLWTRRWLYLQALLPGTDPVRNA